MAFKEDDIAAKLEGYEPLDLHKSGDFSFALKSHHVEVDVSGCSPGEVAEQVLQSPRLRKAVLEVITCSCIVNSARTGVFACSTVVCAVMWGTINIMTVGETLNVGASCLLALTLCNFMK